MSKSAGSQEEANLPAARVRTVWNEKARDMLQGEMSRHGVTYKRLSLLLEQEGIVLSDEALMTRINRGTFSLAFFLQVVRILGTNLLDISHLPKPTVTSARSSSRV